MIQIGRPTYSRSDQIVRLYVRPSVPTFQNQLKKHRSSLSGVLWAGLLDHWRLLSCDLYIQNMPSFIKHISIISFIHLHTEFVTYISEIFHVFVIYSLISTVSIHERQLITCQYGRSSLSFITLLWWWKQILVGMWINVLS